MLHGQILHNSPRFGLCIQGHVIHIDCDKHTSSCASTTGNCQAKAMATRTSLKSPSSSDGTCPKGFTWRQLKSAHALPPGWLGVQLSWPQTWHMGVWKGQVQLPHAWHP